MQTLISFVLALSVGFAHAFEADHLVAVSTLVTRRNNVWLSLKDGAFWGLGHTSTILLVGSVFLLGRFALHLTDFRYLEATVGLMLVGLGSVRLYRFRTHTHLTHGHPHIAAGDQPNHARDHRLAYGVGLIHGLAGSGALVLSVLAQIRETGPGITYLLLFGLGSVAGMMVAAGVFSVPLSARLTARPAVQQGLVIGSSVLCIGLGLKVLYENMPG